MPSHLLKQQLSSGSHATLTSWVLPARVCEKRAACCAMPVSSILRSKALCLALHPEEARMLREQIALNSLAYRLALLQSKYGM
ncbi:MAG TPA: hypothetical protein DCQ53_06140 [Alphaproteobacteria bacterium]|nr:hypothetical protein [Alphaproteobacteria bacterium]